MEGDSYIWLCAVNLLTSAVEAFSQFEFTDTRGMIRFARFVERYFGPEFRATMHLQEPAGTIHAPATTAAEHLYKYFRSGLVHSFCIEWGGLQHKEDGALGICSKPFKGMRVSMRWVSYLGSLSQISGERSIRIFGRLRVEG